MPTLEELASQGDPGTLQSEEQARKLKLRTPQELYELWERQHWLSQEIDFSKDKEDWSRLPEENRQSLIWVLASNYIGEERVTSEFAGLLMA